MPLRKVFAVTAIILCSAFASAKKKAILPADVLRARTVVVIIDPNAGVDVRDPNANRAARADVEKALDQWGRFALVQEALTADLVITVRKGKGNGKLVQPTIGGTPINGTPPVNGSTTSTPTQSTTRAGVRWGGGNPNDPSSAQPSTPEPQIEAGSSQDMFVVYRGTTDPNSSPLDAPSVWRYSGKDALASPSVPAVEAFRKLIAESEKELASHP
jgi:hypothetical protein